MNIETYCPTPKQREAHADKSFILLYGGAKGGGKSVMLVWEAFMLCSEFPNNKIWMGRKRAVDFRDTTLETFKAQIPVETYKINSTEKIITFINGSRIFYGGFDNREDIEKFNSAEYGAILIDQAEEITLNEYSMTRATLRYSYKNRRPRYRIVLTANPAVCWLKEYFLLNPQPDTAYVPALPSDNPYLPAEYAKNLQEAFKFRPELLKAYLYGSWDEIEGSNIIIPYSLIMKAVNRELIRFHSNKKLTVCDPARYGDDETVIYVLKNEKIIDEMIYGEKSTMETAGNMLAMSRKNESDMMAVDGIGIGSGIVDRLRELEEPVFEIISSKQSSNPKKFKNLRAEMWWYAGEKFIASETSIPNDPRLIGELGSVKYNITSDGLIQAEGKDDIKKRIGRSPDRADCYIMGLYSLQFIFTELSLMPHKYLKE